MLFPQVIIRMCNQGRNFEKLVIICVLTLASQLSNNKSTQLDLGLVFNFIYFFPPQALKSEKFKLAAMRKLLGCERSGQV